MLTHVSGASLPLICLSKIRLSNLRPHKLRLSKLIPAALPLSLAALAGAQTKLDRQLSYIDFGLQAVGQFTGTVSGTVAIPATDRGQNVTQNPSSTVGFLGTLRYSPRPYLGAEFNGSYARINENFTYVQNGAATLFPIQAQANEFTFGYLVTPPYAIYGLKPYASAGVGLIRFKPTAGGGQGAPTDARAAYYFNLGLQKDITGRYGVRVGYRQVFYTAPDFYQNYLTINKATSTKEPLIGVYVRF